MAYLGQRIVIGLAMVTVMAGLAAAKPRAAEGLNTFKSRYYTVHTSLGREAVKPYAHQMDVIYWHFKQRFSNFEFKDHFQSNTVYLFRTRDEYNKFMKQFDVDASNTGGMFFYISKRNVKGLATWVKGRPDERIAAVLQHEGFHQFAFTHIGRNLPRWVNEGLAQYFEDAQINGRRFKVGKPNPRRVRFLEQAARQEKLLPLKRVLNMSDDKWLKLTESDRHGAARLYAQAWSMVYFLIEGRSGRYQEAFKQYLQIMAEGKSNRQAAEEAFQVDTFEPMARQWRQFLRRRLFN
jgi:hypothetical protein